MLYKDGANSALSRWFFDNDTDPLTGYFSVGVDFQTSSSLPMSVNVWLTKGVGEIFYAENSRDVSFTK